MPVLALKRSFEAAVLGCGLVVCGAAAFAQAPAPRPAMAAATLQRLLLLDAARAGTRIVAVGDRGAIVLSDDEGRSWRAAQVPAAPLLTAVAFSGEGVGLAVGHDSVILATRDRGETWTQVFAAPAEQRPLLDVLLLDAEHAIAVGAYGAYYESADGGRTWTARKVIPDDKHLNALVDAGAGHLVMLGEAGTILVSADRGATWTPVASPYKGSFFGGVAANDGSVVAFGLRGRIFRSSDKGASWKPVDNARVAALMGGERLPDGALVIAGAAGTALVSRDDGRSFVPIATGMSRAFSKPLAGARDQVLLLGEAGVRSVAVPFAPPKPQ